MDPGNSVRSKDLRLFLDTEDPRMSRTSPSRGNSMSKWPVCVCVHACVFVIQLCQTLCEPMDCSPSGSSVRGILQARILEWVAISFSRGSS